MFWGYQNFLFWDIEIFYYFIFVLKMDEFICFVVFLLLKNYKTNSFVVILLLKSYETYQIYQLLLGELLRAKCFDILRPKCFHNPQSIYYRSTLRAF